MNSKEIEIVKTEKEKQNTLTYYCPIVLFWYNQNAAFYSYRSHNVVVVVLRDSKLFIAK